MLYPCPQHQSASTAVIPTGDPRFLRIEVEGSWHHFKFTHHSSRERHVSVPEFTPSLCHFVTRLYYHFNQLSRNLSNFRSPTVLALRLAAYSNAVSKLHGTVSRRMWNSIWPGLPESEVPIGHVTNGVHFRSWVSLEMNQLYDRYLGPKWREEPADPKLWQRTQSIPAGELWRTHERRPERLVSFSRRRLQAQLKNRGASQSTNDEAEEVLMPEALTIGFARRFATYKRATLLLRDPERLARILNDPQRPVTNYLRRQSPSSR